MNVKEGRLRIGWLLTGAVACVALMACTSPEHEHAVEVSSVMTGEQAREYFAAAESRDPVGPPTVERILNDDGVTIVCQQTFRLRAPGGGFALGVDCCTGQCTVTEGGSIDDCKDAGCRSSGDSCTALTCSGSCKVSKQCEPCRSGPIVALF